MQTDTIKHTDTCQFLKSEKGVILRYTVTDCMWQNKSLLSPVKVVYKHSCDKLDMAASLYILPWTYLSMITHNLLFQRTAWKPQINLT